MNDAAIFQNELIISETTNDDICNQYNGLTFVGWCMYGDKELHLWSNEQIEIKEIDYLTKIANELSLLKSELKMKRKHANITIYVNKSVYDSINKNPNITNFNVDKICGHDVFVVDNIHHKPYNFNIEYIL